MPKTIGIGIAAAIAVVSVIGGYTFFSLQDTPDVLGVNSFELIMRDFAYNGYGFNDYQGGPTLQVKQGDTVRVTLVNEGFLDHEFMLVSTHALEEALEAVEHGAESDGDEHERDEAEQHIHPEMAFPGAMLTLSPGEKGTVEFVADKAGTFAIACFVGEPEVHAALGMHATLVVE